MAFSVASIKEVLIEVFRSAVQKLIDASSSAFQTIKARYHSVANAVRNNDFSLYVQSYPAWWHVTMWGSAFISSAFLLTALVRSSSTANTTTCDTIERGYTCSSEISQYWGQYSPYFKVQSDVSSDIPESCNLTFAQILSRHGARSPTSSKTTTYNETIAKIQQNAKSYEGEAAFLEDLVYSLGADELTPFGEQELYNSGYKFYTRYESLARRYRLFVRASGESRVIASATNFTQGFHSAMLKDSASNRTADYPYNLHIISEEESQNNTMSHSLCTAFENEDDDVISARGQGIYADIVFPAIQERINNLLPGVNLTQEEVSYVMDLCPFYTVADDSGQLSEFCSLFTEAEWHQYDYYQSLNKYYHYGAGDPLGPTQGVGYVNELIARLTHSRVVDHTSTNRTLDSNPSTFPLDADSILFADFSHDNDMTAIYFALGLFNATDPLDPYRIQSPRNETAGYSSAWTVPFAARLYVEKLACSSSAGSGNVKRDEGEYVRFLVNDRVVQLDCADEDGLCVLDEYLGTLDFARSDGNWSACFE